MASNSLIEDIRNNLQARERTSFASEFVSKCCRKCRRRREKRRLRKLERKSRGRPDSKRSNSDNSTSSCSRSSSWERGAGSSPSIRLDPNRTSPSYLERRRITSARKPPIPYNRSWSDSDSDY